MTFNRLILLALCLAFCALPVTAQEDEWFLTQQLDVSSRELGFYVGYPTGWAAGEAENVVAVYELPADEQAALNGHAAQQGYTLRFEVYTAKEGQDLGLPEDGATLEQWRTIINRSHVYEESTDVSEIRFLSWPMLRTRTTDSAGNAVDIVVGFIGAVPFAATLTAPDAESLDAFMPTWEQMLRESDLYKGNVNLGDYSLYLECMGEGRPTVILEPGMNAGYDYLRQTQERVSEFTRVCIHEREKPELGQRTAQAFAEDLHQLLHTAPVDDPYVFAAHSFGGYVVRMYEEAYPDDVAGMVLIESAHEDQLFELQQILSPEYYNTVIDEIRDVPTVDFEASAAQVNGIGRLDDMPLLVLTATEIDITAELNSLDWTEKWIEELQPDLARLSSNGRQIIVSGTTHLTILRNPATVDAIRQVVEAAR